MRLNHWQFLLPLLLLCGFSVKAQTVPVAPKLQTELPFIARPIIDCQVHDSQQEKNDRDLVNKAWVFFKSGNIPDLDAMIPSLKVALDHAPDKPSQFERCDGVVIVYSDDPAKALSLALLNADRKYEIRPALPYARLAYLIGWVSFEHKDIKGAVPFYRKGLLNDPDYPELISELSQSLSMLGQNDEALSVVDNFLATHNDLSIHIMAVLHRKRGYAFIEMGRLDDAESAYKASLEFEPDSKLAKSELKYIAEQRASKLPV